MDGEEFTGVLVQLMMDIQKEYSGRVSAGFDPEADVFVLEFPLTGDSVTFVGCQHAMAEGHTPFCDAVGRNAETLSDAFEIRVEGGETFLEALTALCKVGDGLFAEAPASSVPSEWSYDGVHATDLREVEAMATFFGVDERNPNLVTINLGDIMLDMRLPETDTPFRLSTCSRASSKVEAFVNALNADAVKGVPLEMLLGKLVQEAALWKERTYHARETVHIYLNECGDVEEEKGSLLMGTGDSFDSDCESGSFQLHMDVETSCLHPAMRGLIAVEEEQDSEIGIQLDFPDGCPEPEELACAEVKTTFSRAHIKAPLLHYLENLVHALLEMWPTRASLVTCAEGQCMDASGVQPTPTLSHRNRLPVRPTALQTLLQYGLSWDSIAEDKRESLQDSFSSPFHHIEREKLAEVLDMHSDMEWMTVMSPYLEVCMPSMPSYCPVCLRMHVDPAITDELAPCQDVPCQATFGTWMEEMAADSTADMV